MSPRSVVQALTGPRSLDAGVVQSVSKEKDADGVPERVTVKWDSDQRKSEHRSSELRVLQAH